MVETQQVTAFNSLAYRDLSDEPIYHLDVLCWDHHALRDQMSAADECGTDPGNQLADRVIEGLRVMREAGAVIELPADAIWVEVLHPCPGCITTDSLF